MSKAVYRNLAFSANLADIIDVPASTVARAVDGLFEMARIEERSPTSSPAADAALLICAGVSWGISLPQPREVDRLLAMEFQLEFGAEATSDSRGYPAAHRKPSKETFGTQLRAVLHSAGARDDEHTGVVPRTSADVTLGWSREGQAYGIVSFQSPQREVKLLYSSHPVFEINKPGFMLPDLYFELRERFEIGSGRLRQLARIMRDIGSSPTDAIYDAENDWPEGRLEAAMLQEGWGIYMDENYTYRIGRHDRDRRFANDAEVVKHVDRLAAIGEPLHSYALAFHLREARAAPGGARP